MQIPGRSLTLAPLLLLATGCAEPPSLVPSGSDGYDIVEDWVEPFQAEGFAFGGNSGLFADSPDRIFVVQRGETRLPDPVPPEFTYFAGSIGINVLRGEGRTWQNCIFVLDGDGNVVEVWDQWDELCATGDGPGPHRIRISPYDPERRVWVVHETNNQIYVLSNDGSELLMTLGERGVAGTDETHFGKPQDVAFLPDGRFLVADGYDNARVVVFDAAGDYLTEFGEAGEALGQFRVVHSLAIGPDGLIFVADRDNRRVQLFRESDEAADWYHPDFAPVAEWTGFQLALDVIVNEDAVWVSEVGPPRIIKLDHDGNRLLEWALPTEGPGRYLEMHSFTVDADGNLYGGDNQHGRAQKFVPRLGADPGLLMQAPYVRR